MQTDLEIISEEKNRLETEIKDKGKSDDGVVSNDIEEDKRHGTQMVIDQYLKTMSKDTNTYKANSDTVNPDSNNFALAMGDKIALGLLKMGAGAGKTNGLLSAAVEWWPKLQRPFAKDPIDDAIQTDGSRGKEIKDLVLP